MSLINPDDSLERQNEKLLRIVETLMNHVEHGNGQSGEAYAQFERAALLEKRVRERTLELERTLDLNQRLTETPEVRQGHGALKDDERRVLMLRLTALKQIHGDVQAVDRQELTEPELEVGVIRDAAVRIHQHLQRLDHLPLTDIGLGVQQGQLEDVRVQRTRLVEHAPGFIEPLALHELSHRGDRSIR